MPRAVALPCVALVLAMLPASGTRAYEDQLTVGVDTGYALVLAEGASHGWTVGADASVGLGDLFSLRGRAGYGFHPQGGGLHVAAAGAEVLYLLDVLEWVPYFGVGADGFFMALDGSTRGDLGLHAVLGVEWLASRDWLLGLDVRPYVLPLAFRDAPLDPIYLSVTLRYSLIFDL
ncbi:MAG: hypothetical protein ACOCXM_07990 [Myxococcota bacterium]